VLTLIVIIRITLKTGNVTLQIEVTYDEEKSIIIRYKKFLVNIFKINIVSVIATFNK